MNQFVVSIFKIHTGEYEDTASLWIKISKEEDLRYFTPINFEEEFLCFGVYPWNTTSEISSKLKILIEELGLEYIEHTFSDD